jgi:hypothetical protein
MGYTHYWSYTPADPAFAAAWPQICTDTQSIVERVRHLGIAIVGPDGIGAPMLDRRGIRFNGDAVTGGDHESFDLFPPHPSAAGRQTAFCKTARRPYDLAVTAVLLRLRLLLPEAVTIASDGRWDVEWRHGAAPQRPGTPALGPRTLLETLFGPLPPGCPLRRADALT